MSPKILIIDNLNGLPRFIAMELQAEGYQASVIDNLDKLSMSQSLNHDLILLNWDLRWASAADTCHQLSARSSARAPIIITIVKDKSSGYFSQEAGAQAYLIKPFSMRDLLALIERHLAAIGQKARPVSLGSLQRSLC
jgi:DNA-binding response OmpR family regulator